MLADDVLADQVVVDRPPVLVLVGSVPEPDGGEVVGEGVEPDVGDMLGIPRQRDAPLERRAADREVAQAAADQAECLVAAVLRRHRRRVLRVPVEQAIFEAREAEEVVLLLEVLDRAQMDRAQVLDAVDGDEIFLGVVELARDAVQALEHVEFDVAGVVATLEEFGDGGLVAGFGGADEVVVGDVQPSPRLGELRGDAVGELLRGEPGRLGSLLDLEAVLVGAGEELHLVAEEAVPAGDCVADDGRVGVPEVRLRVDVVDRCRHIEPGHRIVAHPIHARGSPNHTTQQFNPVRWCLARTHQVGV